MNSSIKFALLCLFLGLGVVIKASEDILAPIPRTPIISLRSKPDRYAKLSNLMDIEEELNRQESNLRIPSPTRINTPSSSSSFSSNSNSPVTFSPFSPFNDGYKSDDSSFLDSPVSSNSPIPIDSPVPLAFTDNISPKAIQAEPYNPLSKMSLEQLYEHKSILNDEYKDLINKKYKLLDKLEKDYELYLINELESEFMTEEEVDSEFIYKEKLEEYIEKTEEHLELQSIEKELESIKKSIIDVNKMIFAQKKLARQEELELKKAESEKIQTEHALAEPEKNEIKEIKEEIVVKEEEEKESKEEKKEDEKEEAVKESSINPDPEYQKSAQAVIAIWKKLSEEPDNIELIKIQSAKARTNLQLYYIKKGMKFNLPTTNNFTKKQTNNLRNAIILFKDIPGAIELIEKIIFNGYLVEQKINIDSGKNMGDGTQNFMGFSYEILVADKLYKSNIPIIAFGQKYEYGYKDERTKKYKLRKFDIDIETSKSYIECKNWNWDKDQKIKMEKIKSDFKLRNHLAQEHKKEFLLISNNKIPQELTDWLDSEKIKHAVIPIFKKHIRPLLKT